MPISEQNLTGTPPQYVPDTWIRPTAAFEICAGQKIVADAGFAFTIAAMNEDETFRLATEQYGAITIDETLFNSAVSPDATDVLFIKAAVGFDVFDLSEHTPSDHVTVNNVTALKAYDGTTVSSVYVLGFASAGDGGHKNVTWVAGNFTSEVTLDPNGGFFIASNDDPTGASGVWITQPEADEVHSRFWVPVKGSGGDYSPIWEAQLVAAQYMETTRKAVTMVIQGGDFYFDTAISALTDGISLSVTKDTGLRCNFLLQDSLFDGAATNPQAFAFQFGTDDLDTDDIIVERVFTSGGIKQWERLVLTTDYTVSATASVTTVTTTGLTVAGTKNYRVYNRLKCGFIKIEASQVSVTGGGSIDTTATVVAGVGVHVFASDTGDFVSPNEREFGDNLVLGVEVTATTGAWTNPVQLDGSTKTATSVVGIREIDFTSLTTFRGYWFGLSLVGIATGNVREHNHFDGGITSFGNMLISGSSSLDSTNIRYKGEALGNIILGYCDDIDISGTALTDVFAHDTNSTDWQVTIPTRVVTGGIGVRYNVPAGATGTNLLSFLNDGTEKGYVGQSNVANNNVYGWSTTGIYYTGGQFGAISQASSVQIYTNSSGFYPVADNTVPLGGASNRWSEVFAGNATINTSNEDEKKRITDITKRKDFEKLREFAALQKPISWIFKDGGKRTHFGYGAKATRNNLKTVGLLPADMSFYSRDQIIDTVYDIGEDGEKLDTFTETPRVDKNSKPVYTYGLRLGELQAVLYAVENYERKLLETRIDALEKAK